MEDSIDASEKVWQSAESLVRSAMQMQLEGGTRTEQRGRASPLSKTYSRTPVHYQQEALSISMLNDATSASIGIEGISQRGRERGEWRQLCRSSCKRTDIKSHLYEETEHIYAVTE